MKADDCFFSASLMNLLMSPSGSTETSSDLSVAAGDGSVSTADSTAERNTDFSVTAGDGSVSIVSTCGDKYFIAAVSAVESVGVGMIPLSQSET